MKQFISFVIKEARHILRDKRTMLILFGMPTVMMLIFGFAITTDVKNVRLVAVTSQMDHETQAACDRLAASEYFTLTATVPTPREAELLIRSQKADLAVVFGKRASSLLSMVPTPTWHSSGRTMPRVSSFPLSRLPVAFRICRGRW